MSTYGIVLYIWDTRYSIFFFRKSSYFLINPLYILFLSCYCRSIGLFTWDISAHIRATVLSWVDFMMPKYPIVFISFICIACSSHESKAYMTDIVQWTSVCFSISFLSRNSVFPILKPISVPLRIAPSHMRLIWIVYFSFSLFLSFGSDDIIFESIVMILSALWNISPDWTE